MSTKNNSQNKTQMTGYPSIDKPWLKYFREEILNESLPECSICEYMCESNKATPERIALVYAGNKISYGTLIDNIDRAANAFYNAGIREGDVVIGIAPSVPEIIYSFYALNKIGAISDWFDPRTDTDIVSQELKETKAKAIIVFEDFLPKFAKIVEDGNIEIRLTVNVRDSLKMIPKLIMSVKTKIQSYEGWIPFHKFVSGNQTKIKLKTPDKPKDIPALLEHTGGTTGLPKAVVLTNYNINSVVYQYRYFLAPLLREESFFSVAFPFVAYSIIIGIHAPLCFGMSCGLCFEMEVSKMEKMLLKGKYNHMANTPVVWEYLIHSRKAQKSDFSFLIKPAVGADTLNTAKEREINHFLREHGCKYNIIKGYGMTELGSAASGCLSNECNKIGSVGIPFHKTTISIFDIDTQKELTYGEQGEICITGPSVMNGYFNRPEATSDVLKKHEDGLVWMHSGDIGHMDEDGFIFIDGRIKRMIIDHHGFKIFAPNVEAVISDCPYIDKCCVVGEDDKKFGAGQIAVAFVILKKNNESTIEEIKEMCEQRLPDYSIPSKYIIVDEFPYTSAGKVDYRKLEQQCRDVH